MTPAKILNVDTGNEDPPSNFLLSPVGTAQAPDERHWLAANVG